MTTPDAILDRARTYIEHRSGHPLYRTTSAQTLPGLLRAVRQMPPPCRRSAWPPAGRVAQPGAIVTGDAAAIRAACARLVNRANGHARTRLVRAENVLDAALRAALGQRVMDIVGRVPHSYRGVATATARAAWREGRMVLIDVSRVTMSSSSNGVGSDVFRGSRASAVIFDRTALLRLLPRLPAPYRWAADTVSAGIARRAEGARILGHLGAVWATTQTADACLTAVREQRVRQAHAWARDRASRVDIRRAVDGDPERVITLGDAHAQGYCLPGIRDFATRAGWPREQQTATARDVYDAAVRLGETRALRVLRRVLRPQENKQHFIFLGQ